MQVLQIDMSTILDEGNVILVCGDFPRQSNSLAGDLVPTRLENRILQNHLRCAEVLDADFLCSDLKDLGDVKGAGGLVTNGDELLQPQWLAVDLVEALGRGIGFGLACFLRQDVGSYALKTSLCGILHDGIRGAAEALRNCAWSSPSGNMFSSPPNLCHLLRCGWDRAFFIFSPISKDLLLPTWLSRAAACSRMNWSWVFANWVKMRVEVATASEKLAGRSTSLSSSSSGSSTRSAPRGLCAGDP
jgi:hypothetical protein